MNRLARNTVVALVVVAAVVCLAAGVRAQGQARPQCPDVPQTASSAEQALCWFERDRRSEPGCAGDPGFCIERAAAWCDEATLDDPRVANACFLAPLRVGRYQEAHALAEYLTEPTDHVRKCRDTLRGLVEVRVVTIPRGAEVAVGDRGYGPAPIEVRLPSPWWKQTVTVRFGDEVVEAGSEAIAEAFDARVCEMGDLVIEGPDADAPASEPPPERDPEPGVASGGGGASLSSQTGVSPPGGGGAQTVGWVAIGAGAAALATAAVFGNLSLKERRDLDGHCGESAGYGQGFCDPEADVHSIADRFERNRNIGWALLGAGVAAAAAGGALLWLGSDAESERAVTPGAGCTGDGCTATLRGVF